jgi:phage major head subunit gpT-like protein
MQITPSNLTWLFNNWNLMFQSGYDETAPWWSQIATMKSSTTEQESYAFSSRVMQLREWVGEREMRSVGTYLQTIVNKDFESTVEVDRNKILDDTYGIFDFPMRDLGRAARKWPDVLLLNALQNGQTQACYDGQNFFDPAHPVDRYAGQIASGTQQNYWSSGMALSFDNYQTVRKTMMEFKGEDGLPLGVTPNLLVVPAALEVTARLICEADSVAPQTLGANTQVGANTNVLKGTAKVLIIPELANQPTQWYLMDTTKGMKPFVFQQRQAPNMITLRDPSNENVFKRKKFAFGVDTRGNAAGGLWFLASKASA